MYPTYKVYNTLNTHFGEHAVVFGFVFVYVYEFVNVINCD